MMYLLPDVNLRLRPRLLAELRPGTRIVSHAFSMGDWKPARKVDVGDPPADTPVYLWVIPAREPRSGSLSAAPPIGRRSCLDTRIRDRDAQRGRPPRLQQEDRAMKANRTLAVSLCVASPSRRPCPWPGAGRGAASSRRTSPTCPRPPEVVERMLDLGGVKSGDVLYDLGCGDGRIVIAAVKKPGVRGVCVDIDPERIADSKRNAEAAGVTDRDPLRARATCSRCPSRTPP